MRTWLNRIFWAICRFFLSFRYRVRVSGREQLSQLSGPTLVLPNHPAYIDPPLVSSHLRMHRPLRPLVFSGTYRMWPLRPLLGLVEAIEVPDMSSHSRDAQSKALEMIDSVVERLKQGDCVLIYPAGRLQRGNEELVGAARSVHEIVRRCPELNIALVRTRGVWGSRFSCAATGEVPKLGREVWRALGWVLANGFIFLPRRPVHMQVEVVRPQDLPTESRAAFNSHLESWYNADGDLEPRFVRYHPWFGPSRPNFNRRSQSVDYDVEKIPAKTIRLVNELVQAHLGRELTEEEARADTQLETIGLDSLDRMDLALKIEQQFSFRSDRVTTTLGGLWALADGQLPTGNGTALAAPEAWKQRSGLGEQPAVLAETITAAWIARYLAGPDRVAAADAVSGVLTYRKMLIAAHLMSKRFARLEAEHVGVMLPASVAADLVFFALHLAGKTPVMMNWTTGPANLAHSVQVTEIDQIVTSKKLIDRLGIDVEGAEYVFLEDIKQGIGKPEALAALLCTYLLPGWAKRLIPQEQPDDIAVFLFTSGSESFPKTVPLTHRNLLVNIRDGLEVLSPDSSDSLLGFLPPFHSFGMTGNLLLPHLGGIPCVRHADPTDARGLVQVIEKYRPSMIFTTPTFLSYILASARGDSLHSLRKIITGAEKCPEAVFERCRQAAPKAIILEGYGITECSPVVAANRPDQIKPGTVGKPVSHVDSLVIDVETEQPVAPGETGMLLVAGPSIFSGYYRHEGDTPFVEIEGRQWYKTGDLVSVDEDGFIRFQGRLKRFLKAGGEMISLPALETPLALRFPPDDEGPQVAVEGVETHDGRHIVLFTTTDMSLRQASEILLEAGLRGVMRLDEVQRVERIPVLGTGKIDYKQLRQQVLDSSHAVASGEGRVVSSE